jgi:outer membrane protein OmpA-like peptidoglycan-associated protein
MELKVLQFSEQKTVKFNMLPNRALGPAKMQAEVEYKDGQFWIKIKYDKMKPAILFSGDVTSYAVWAVNRDGVAVNLGELWVKDNKQDILYQTGLRNFALMVTAEKYYQVDRPSEFVVFWNDGIAEPRVRSDSLIYDEFAPAPATGVSSLETVQFSGSKPIDLVQAEKLIDLAKSYEAEKYAPGLLRQATIAFDQATHMFERKRKDGAEQFSRRSVAASNEAIGLSVRMKQKEELEAEIKARQAEMAALEGRADEAEKRAADLEALAAKIDAEKTRTEAEMKATSEQLEKMRTERTNVEKALNSLRAEQESLKASMAALEREKEGLQEEKSDLQDRLQGALSQVAETTESARGLIVNLPDILFDLGQANLKSEARIVLAKLSGILLIMPDLNLRVEGHTDSTGSASGNLRLSKQRADSVFDFLSEQGIEGSRMVTAGYGQDRPIADNSTNEGRSKNRRVEIIIGEGEIAE